LRLEIRQYARRSWRRQSPSGSVHDVGVRDSPAVDDDLRQQVHAELDRVRRTFARHVAEMTADGQVQRQLTAGDVVTIRRSQRTIRLLYLRGSSFFETLRRKLNWSGSNV
jgi:NAD kinase